MRRYRRNTDRFLTYQQICRKWDQMINEYGIRDQLQSKLRMLCQSKDIESFKQMFELLIGFGDEALCEILVEYPSGQIGLNLSLPCIKANVSDILFKLYEHVSYNQSPIWEDLFNTGKMLAIDSDYYENALLEDVLKEQWEFENVVEDFSAMVPIVPTNGMKPFYIGRYEVTQALWYDVFSRVTSNISNDPSPFKGATRPVHYVSWNDCVIFCNLLSKLQGLQAVYKITDRGNGKFDVKWNRKANGYRLLTEAEWEYCAKAGKDTIHSGSDNIDEVAWYSGNSLGDTHGVGQLSPNGFGLYDMSGNVNEWLWDSNIIMRKHPARVQRGGSYAYDARIFDTDSSIALSFSAVPTYKSEDLGFRLARNME